MGDPTKHYAYVCLMLVLSILSLVGLAISTVGFVHPEQQVILDAADFVVCGLFFVDFLLSYFRAPNKLAYLMRWGWLDLVSSIPMIGPLRLARAARIVRILRLLRGVKSAKVLAQLILERRAQSALLAASLICLLLVVVSSIAILQVEVSPTSNIRTAEDAVWWSVTTIATVGYGDLYPVTLAGRLIAAALLICGIGLVGTLSGFVASWFLKPAKEIREAELTVLIEEVRELKERLKQ